MHPSNIQEELHIKAEDLAKKFLAYSVGDKELVSNIDNVAITEILKKTTALVFQKLKTPNTEIIEPVADTLPVSKDNIEVVSFMRDNLIADERIDAVIKTSTRSAREEALKARGDLKQELAEEISATVAKRHVSGPNAADYQKRYDENKCLLEILGVTVFDLQKLKDSYAKQNGGASHENSENFSNLLDNAVYHLREGKIDQASLSKIGLDSEQTKTIAKNLSQKLEAIKAKNSVDVVPEESKGGGSAFVHLGTLGPVVPKDMGFNRSFFG